MPAGASSLSDERPGLSFDYVHQRVLAQSDIASDQAIAKPFLRAAGVLSWPSYRWGAGLLAGLMRLRATGQPPVQT